MSRTLTASDRRSLIRLANTLPKGSEERRVILAGLSKSAATRYDHNGQLMTLAELAREAVGKDVFVDLYAPWCTACREMEPTYERLAKRLQGLDIIVASMDATRNDVPTMFDMQQYPSLCVPCRALFVRWPG